MSDHASPYLDLWKDWQPAVALEQKAAGSELKEPATGLTGVTFRVALTEQGAPITGLENIAATEVGSTGVYRAAVNLATLTSALPSANPAYAHGTVVYLQVFKTGDIETEAFRKTLRRTKY